MRELLRPEGYSHIIWDWNGTLLNDVDWSVRVVNRMLLKRGLKPLSGVEGYRSVFGFPIVHYYERAGFDFTDEPFEKVAEEYISLYYSEEGFLCGLHDGVEAALAAFRDQGLSQVILSASKADILAGQVARYPIRDYFDALLGISDIYARSKVEVGRAYMERGEVKRALLIGDTEHDFEVARELGADCLLIANGHQPKEKLLRCGVPVLDSLLEAAGLLAAV